MMRKGHSFVVCLSICLCACQINLDKKIDALGDITKGYDFELHKMKSKSPYDSAIVYFRMAIQIDADSKTTSDAMFAITEAFHHKYSEAQSTKEGKASLDSAVHYFSQLQDRDVEEGRMFVLEKLVLNNDSKWWYDKEHKKVYHVTD